MGTRAHDAGSAGQRHTHSMHWSSLFRFWFSTMAAISLAFSSSICRGPGAPAAGVGGVGGSAATTAVGAGAAALGSLHGAPPSQQGRHTAPAVSLRSLASALAAQLPQRVVPTWPIAAGGQMLSATCL